MDRRVPKLSRQGSLGRRCLGLVGPTVISLGVVGVSAAHAEDLGDAGSSWGTASSQAADSSSGEAGKAEPPAQRPWGQLPWEEGFRAPGHDCSGARPREWEPAPWERRRVWDYGSLQDPYPAHRYGGPGYRGAPSPDEEERGRLPPGRPAGAPEPWADPNRYDAEPEASAPRRYAYPEPSDRGWGGEPPAREPRYAPGYAERGAPNRWRYRDPYGYGPWSGGPYGGGWDSTLGDPWMDFGGWPGDRWGPGSWDSYGPWGGEPEPWDPWLLESRVFRVGTLLVTGLTGFGGG